MFSNILIMYDYILSFSNIFIRPNCPLISVYLLFICIHRLNSTIEIVKLLLSLIVKKINTYLLQLILELQNKTFEINLHLIRCVVIKPLTGKLYKNVW